MPWDRHKVRNCPVTQARGLPHGTAEQQAASRSSGGPATPQTPASAPAGVVETLRAPVPAGMWPCPPRARAGPQAGVFPHGKGWRDRAADGGLLWVLRSTSALACPGWSGLEGTGRGRGAGSGAVRSERAILCTVDAILCHLPAPQVQLWHRIDHSDNSVMCFPPSSVRRGRSASTHTLHSLTRS